MTFEVGNEQVHLRSFMSTMYEALWSEEGLRYFARGGLQVNAGSFQSYLGAEMSFPPGVQLKRRARSDTSATILSTIYIREGEALIDESNGSVQINGVRNQDETAAAIWGGRVSVADAPEGSALESIRSIEAVVAGSTTVNQDTFSFKDSKGRNAVVAGTDGEGGKTIQIVPAPSG